MRVSVPPALMASTTPLRNQGLTTARPFDAAMRKHEFLKMRLMSSSSILVINAFLISYVVALHRERDKSEF